MTIEDKNIILDLYFEKMYNYEMILKRFKKKYTYKEIKVVIDEQYKNAGNNIFFERRKNWFNQ